MGYGKGWGRKLQPALYLYRSTDNNATFNVLMSAITEISPLEKCCKAPCTALMTLYPFGGCAKGFLRGVFGLETMTNAPVSPFSCCKLFNTRCSERSGSSLSRSRDFEGI